jgi:hypothetical protein
MRQIGKPWGMSPLSAFAASGLLFITSVCVLSGVYWKSRVLIVDAFGVKNCALQIQERAIDHGNVHIGDQARFTFHLFNQSQENIHILNVRAGCSCTKVFDFSHDVAPGSWGQVTVEVDTTGMPGTRSSSVLIETDDQKRPRLNPMVSCWVLPAAGTEPERLRFVPEESTGGFRSQIVKVVGFYNGETIEIGDIFSSDPQFVVAKPAKTKSSRGQFEVTVDKDIPAGATLAHLTINLNGSLQNKIRLPVTVVNELRLKSEPSILNLSSGSGASQTAEFAVTAFDNGTLIVESVELAGRTMRVASQRMANNAVTVRLDDLRVTNDLNGQHIYVSTNQGKIRVPMVVTPRANGSNKS